MTKPATQKEMVEQMWWKIFGMNGKDGMANEISHIKNNMVTQRECSARQNKPSVKVITAKKLLEGFIGTLAVALVVGGVILLLAGRLTAEDIAKILEAWRG